MKTKPGSARSANAKPKPWATITLLVAAGFGCVVSIGMIIRRGERRTAASEAARLKRPDDETSGAAAGLPRWRGVAAPQTGEVPPTSAPGDPALARAETAFDELAKGLDAGLLARLQSGTELGRRIARLALFPRVAAQLDRDTLELLRATYVPELREHGAAAIQEVRGMMAKVDSLAYAQERLSLYSVLTAVPDVRSTMEELSHDDLTKLVPPAQPDPGADRRLTLQEQQAALSWGPDRVLPLMAYNYYSVATRNDPDLALDGTVDALVAQVDGKIREGIATRFVTDHPDLKTSLYAELAKRSVTIPDVNPTVIPPSTLPSSDVPTAPMAAPRPAPLGG